MIAYAPGSVEVGLVGEIGMAQADVNRLCHAIASSLRSRQKNIAAVALARELFYQQKKKSALKLLKII